MASPLEAIGNSAGMGGDLIRNAVGLITAGTVVMNSIAKVPKNHRGFRTVRGNPERTWGRKKGQRYGSVGSGFHFVYPFVGGVESRSMQKQPTDLPAFNVECKDGKHIADASTLWHVKKGEEEGSQEVQSSKIKEKTDYLTINHLRRAYYGVCTSAISWYFKEEQGPQAKPGDEHLYNALFEIEKDKLDDFIRFLARTGVVAAASQLTREELLKPNAALPATLELYGETFDAHGVALDGIFVTSLGRSEAQVIGEMLGNPGEPIKPLDAGTMAATLHIAVNE